MDVIILTIEDTLDLLHTAELKDLMTPLFALFWLTILAFPLKNIDRRDGTTFSTYTVYMLATGITLFLAIPNLLVEDSFSLGKHLVFVVALVPLIAVRWLMFKKEKSHG